MNQINLLLENQDVQAIDGAGQLVAAGQIDRAIVDRQRLLASVSADAGHQ